jgi:pre-mRNA-processing factor 17
MFHLVGHVAKRRRTEAEVEAERKARQEKKAAKEAALASQREAAANGGAFRLKAVQPWADKEGKQEELTEEQKEYLAKVEAEKKAKEAEKEKTEGVCSISHRILD